MPFGAFLDQFPAALFIAAHLLFLGIGGWAIYSTGRSPVVARAFGLYAVSQLMLLSTFFGVLTLKMAVLLEQTLIVLLVLTIAIALRGPRTAASQSASPARAQS